MTEVALAERVEKYIDKNIIEGTFEPDRAALHIASMAIEHFRTIHSKALACHCECLGMNAENMWAAIGNHPPVFLQFHIGQYIQ